MNAQKVLLCKSLINLIKDFAGLLAEFPIYFITKFSPRKWKYKWWEKNLNPVWLCPSTCTRLECYKTVILYPSPMDLMNQKFYFDSIPCYFDEYKNVWPINTFNSQGVKDLKQWNSSNIDTQPTEEKGLFTFRPLNISIACILYDLDANNICTMVQQTLFSSPDFTFELAQWYTENLFTLSKRTCVSLRDKFAKSYINESAMDLIHFSKEKLLWLQPNVNEIPNWLKYHFNDLTWKDWKLSRNDPWMDLHHLFVHKLYPTIFKFIHDFSRDFNSLTDILTWRKSNNFIELAEMVYLHNKSNFCNIRMNLEDASAEIFEFFIGKVGCGLVTYFDTKAEHSIIQTKTIENGSWEDRFLSTDSQDRKLLFKAWSFFTPKEKRVCLDLLCVEILKSPHLICLTYNEEDYFLNTSTAKKYEETIFSFFKNLLTGDIFIDLIYRTNDPMKEEILYQFQKFSKKKKDKKASVYLFLFFNLVPQITKTK